MMGAPHPIPYQGSRRGLADVIIAYLPKEMAEGRARIIEPFAGSAAIWSMRSSLRPSSGSISTAFPTSSAMTGERETTVMACHSRLHSG